MPYVPAAGLQATGCVAVGVADFGHGGGHWDAACIAGHSPSAQDFSASLANGAGGRPPRSGAKSYVFRHTAYGNCGTIMSTTRI